MIIPHNNDKIKYVELQYMDQHHHRHDVFLEYNKNDNIQVFSTRIIIFV